MRRTGFKNRGGGFGRSKKADEWERIKREILKPAFRDAGITYCELGIADVCINAYLSFAHAVKRNNINKQAIVGETLHITTVCLACQKCHEFIEHQPKGEHWKMAWYVLQAIDRRQTPVDYGKYDSSLSVYRECPDCESTAYLTRLCVKTYYPSKETEHAVEYNAIHYKCNACEASFTDWETEERELLATLWFEEACFNGIG